MNLLKSATRTILNLIPMLSVPKESFKISEGDYLTDYLVKFRKNSTYILVKDDRHSKEMMKDTSIIKDFLSTEIKEEYAYLPFVRLGIEYLTQHAELEDAQKGEVILDIKIRQIMGITIEHHIASH